MGDFLPDVRDADEFDRLRPNEELWQPALAEIAERHRLAGRRGLFPTGSAVVFGVGDDYVVKLYEPWHREHFATEAAALALVHNQLPVASPELIATGELDGWSYVIMSRLQGDPLCLVRDRIDHANLVAIAQQTGALARAFHALSVPESFRPFRPWSDFVDEQRAGCRARHRAHDVPEQLLATLDDQLIGVDLSIDEPVFLHTELTDTNLLVAHSDGRWRLSGVFDFEPSMLGHPHYDLPGFTMFVARGDPEMCREALAAFGLQQLDAALRRRLLACTLLHRYSHLRFFLRQVGVHVFPQSWDQLAKALLGF